MIGLRIIPLSLRLTRSTSAAWRSGVMFLCSTPMPPARAIAMAMSASVTVSMAAEMSGMLRGMRAGEAGDGGDLARMHRRVSRDQEHVVEGEAGLGVG